MSGPIENPNSRALIVRTLTKRSLNLLRHPDVPRIYIYFEPVDKSPASGSIMLYCVQGICLPTLRVQSTTTQGISGM